MADIDRDRVTTVERDSSAVWGIVALLVIVLLVVLFVWPGWVVAPFANDNDSDTINIEQEQVQPDQDINIVVPGESDETT
ncbi:MAG: hypothetical protein Q7W44_02155 [Coriobacteriia bacterium]|nr:hypothetical protein [Coriobacteriia bacterium]